MNNRHVTAIALTLAPLIALGPASSYGEEGAEELIRASRDFVINAASVEIHQTVEQTVTVTIDGQAVAPKRASAQTSTVEIDTTAGVVRMTTKDTQGQDLAVIRDGERVAMKIGDHPWQHPNGPYANLAKNLARPFACELPPPGGESPTWEIVGTQKLGESDVTVIQSVEGTGLALAERQMSQGFVAMFPDATTRPQVKVEAYTSRHWVEKHGNRRRQVVQTSRYNVSMLRPDGKTQTNHVHMTSTAVYRRYGEVTIEIPDEARAILTTTSGRPLKAQDP